MLQKGMIDKEILQYIFNNSYQAIIVLSSNNTILAINPKAVELLNLSEQDIIGRNLESICPELVINGRIINGVTNLISGTKVENRLVYPEKTFNKILFLEEITEKEDISILEKVINSIDEAVMVCDSQGKFIIYNEANERLDGLKKEQVLGKHVSSVYNLTEETSLLLQAMRKRKPFIDRHQSYTNFAGKNLNIMCNTYPLFQGDKVIGAVSIQRDYSKIKKLSEKIIDLQEQLYEKNLNRSSNVSKKTGRYSFDDIIGVSDLLKQTIIHAKRAAKTNSPILIYGETGTGKELFAQSIHNYSQRSAEPFIGINCAAIPENLLEGILFGTVKGAYTGAVDRPGLFEQANGGTLLLDEINSMSLGLQAKLLRVLQENLVRRVGAIDEIAVDVRIITNMNIEPAVAIEKNLLRQDLFYRLGVVYLKIPLLKDRKEDIPILTKHFINKYNKILNKNVKGISDTVLEKFSKYSWPGNVRELQHVIESAMNIMVDKEEVIRLEHIPLHIVNIVNKFEVNVPKKQVISITVEEEPLINTMERFEKQVILQTLEKSNWNISNAARKLKLKRQSLQYRLKKYGVNREEA